VILTESFIVKYDRAADSLYIKLKEGKVVESDEVAPGVILDFDEKGEVIGVEIVEFSKRRIDLSEIVLKGPEALVIGV